MPVHADSHAQDNGQYTKDTGNSKGSIALINHEAKNDCYQDKQQRNHSNGCIGGASCHIKYAILINSAEGA